MVQGAHWLTWTPYDNSDVITFDSRGIPFTLREMVGFSSNLIQGISRKTPGQLGETLIGLGVGAKALTIACSAVAETEQDKEEYWALRRQLVAALATPLPRAGERPRLGTLRIHRPGQPVLKVDGVPVDSPRETGRIDTGSVNFDVVILAPDPYWRAEDDTESVLAETATEFPLTFPLEIQSFNISVTVDNVGDVSVPLLARIYGDVINPRLVNNTTGKMIDLTYHVEEGDYVEINTAYGKKEITLHRADDTTENLLPYIDLGTSEFFDLERGSQQVRFDADNNISGSAELIWTPKFAGV